MWSACTHHDTIVIGMRNGFNISATALLLMLAWDRLNDDFFQYYLIIPSAKFRDIVDATFTQPELCIADRHV